MKSCDNCGSDETRTLKTQYGEKEVCDECGHLIKDVDQYRGTMLFGHKTGSEIEIHANAESVSVISNSKRHSVAPGKVKIIRHAGELAGRHSNNTRASVDIIKAGNIKPESLTANQQDEQYMSWIRNLPTPILFFSKCYEGKTHTSFSFSILKKIESHLKSCFLNQTDPIPGLIKDYHINRNQVLYILALRKKISPYRANCPNTIKIVSKDNKFFVPQFYR